MQNEHAGKTPWRSWSGRLYDPEFPEKIGSKFMGKSTG